MSYQPRTGAVLFATRVDQVAAFYANVLGLTEAHRDDDHVLLESQAFQLVVHRIPGHPATTSEPGGPPARRANAAFKPVFFVSSFRSIRDIAAAHGGAMDAPDKEWSFNGILVCDAIDPDGNVVQFRELGDHSS